MAASTLRGRATQRAEPIPADLAGGPPVIEMSCLPGVPLGGAALSTLQADALASALERLWHAAPAAAVTDWIR